ncbi:MAG: hypothetical protein LC754_16480 [Acidobacteria bacterium]|nr:hypothetical protein [Acidobacteriota bacterium]
MKNVSRFLTTLALATTFTLPAFAQTTPAQGAATATASAPTAQDAEAKAALYKKFLDNRSKKDAAGNPDPAAQKVAYEAGKEYLSKYGSDTSEGNDKIVEYIKKWVGNYEKAVREYEFTQAVKTDPAKALQMGRQTLAEQPDNFAVMVTLVQVSAENKGFSNDAANFSRQALQLVEGGKVTTLTPFKTRDEAVGYLNYTRGVALMATSPDEAVKAFLNAAQANSLYKTEPTTYFYLGNLYLDNEYKKVADDYKRLYEGKDKTPESEAMYVRLNQALDRVIDAYARAIALSTKTDPKTQEFKSKLLTTLTTIYKGRHDNSDAGLKEFIAGVTSKPLPIPGQESAPTPAPATNGTPAPGATPMAGGTQAGPTTVTTTTKTTTTTQPVNTAKPATTTPPATVKPTPKPSVPPTTLKPTSKSGTSGSKTTVGRGRQ